ncbi:TetR/AcrR family transcriptional regulator [Mycobacterium sp. MMS18-G62]
MAPRRDPGRRLTDEDWIQTGFVILAETGPNALRVDALCKRLNVTKGSFYWHFADMQTYRTALIDAWANLNDEHRRPFEDMRDVEPRERLALMLRTWVTPQQWDLERAMRAWALTDETVLASVQRSDRRILRAITQAFADVGFLPEDAALRATVLVATGIGFLQGSTSVGYALEEMRERFLDFMLRP